MWYVIQVKNGIEEEIRQQCERVIEKRYTGKMLYSLL